MTSNTINSDTEKARVFGLDLFRAIAIIFVVISHGGFLLNETRFSDFPYIKMIDGVDLFFVLSGFLIGSILLKEINSEKRFGIRELGHFWKRRWFRTLPNYYLILLVNYFLIHSKIILEDIQQFNWKFFFFLQNFSEPFYGFFWESWSLTIEEWFYISSPLLLIVFLKFLTPKRSFFAVTLLMIVFPFLYRMWILNPKIDDFWYDVTFRKIVLCRLDSIAYGLLAAWTCYYYREYWDKFRIPGLILGIALITFLVEYESPNSSFYRQVANLSLSPISAMLLLPFAAGLKSASGFIGRGITHISKISYSMYLINLAVVAEVIRDNFPPTTEGDRILKYFLYWFFVIAGSTLLYKYFEKPVMNLRDK